jgi:hypothetical protein
LFASVTLALDKDLEPLPKGKDPRLSKETGAAVKQILKATTLGEVLPEHSSVHVAFRTLSLQVFLFQF